MALFQDALSELLVHEGGWVNDPDDPGAETYCGISRKYYPDWGGWNIIDSYKGAMRFPSVLSEVGKLKTLVEQFYFQEWWTPLQLGMIQEQESANEILEMAVNIGKVNAIRIVQNALNLLNQAGVLYKETLVDGIIGIETIGLINRFTGKRRPLVKAINHLQADYYIKKIEQNPKKKKFFYGWLSRT